MSGFKIEALKQCRVTAQIGFLGSIDNPPNRQGQSMGKQPAYRNREETFDLKIGETRDDVDFVHGVHQPNGMIKYFNANLAPGESVDFEGLRITSLE